VVEHFCNRGYEGKGMLIALDKITAVRMYDLITLHWKLYTEQLERELLKGKFGDQELLEKNRKLQWVKETEICVVISSEQNEIQKFKNWDLDIEPHRIKMNTDDLETRFKEAEDPFRFVIVCAMWITGFDVPTLSTLYLDKPLKSHTLMQAIARANRISQGKNNGLIVDYIETYSSLLSALAIYGSGDNGGKNGKPETPVLPTEVLVKQLEEALVATEAFLEDEVEYTLSKLIQANGLEKIAQIQAGLEAIYVNDETKRKFQILAREVFLKYKALQPNKILNEYAPRKNAIDALYSAIESNIEQADVSDIMKRIQNVIDQSVETHLEKPESQGEIQKVQNVDTQEITKANREVKVDLSNLNFEVLQNHFTKTKHKNTLVQSLKNRIEKQLKRMVENNPTRVDFYKRYQEIIDAYNRGKDAVSVEEAFRGLMDIQASMTMEEVETKREGLTEEQKAIFDLLKKPDLTNHEKKQIKEIAIELLEELKKDKLQVEQWVDKVQTNAAVFTTVSNTLFTKLPTTYEKYEVTIKTNLVFEHLKNQYYGGGRSVYGGY